MKKMILILLSLSFIAIGRTQSVGIGTTTPNASAQLDVSSTTKGFLAPRMTAAQRTAIAAPAQGLLVYQTDVTAGLYVYSVGVWTLLSIGSNGWSLTGNAGTVDNTYFIGTTDNVPFNIRVNNQKAGRIDPISDNTYYGYLSGNANTTGTNNTAIGLNALLSNSAGSYNTAIGNNALSTNTNGINNTAIGQNALTANTSGSLNTASGQFALASNMTGGNNMANGHSALFSNTTGSSNTSSGASSLLSNTEGSENTAAGTSALQNNTTGSSNTAMGTNSLHSNIDGYNNTAIGSHADVSSGSLFNATAIGANASVGSSNSLVLGNNANVGIGTTTPAASAQLDVSSTALGFLPPRMTAAQRNAILNPAIGLIVWCTDCGSDGGELEAFNGLGGWRTMNGDAAGNAFIFTIGAGYKGGIIAYILQPGDPGYIAGQSHGLIANLISFRAEWGCIGLQITPADSTALGTGNQNTIAIMAACATAGIAARIYGDSPWNGYNDWYLPSKDELNKLYINRDVLLTGVCNCSCWSSSEFSSTGAWEQDFDTGAQHHPLKSISDLAFAVRDF